MDATLIQLLRELYRSSNAENASEAKIAQLESELARTHAEHEAATTRCGQLAEELSVLKTEIQAGAAGDVDDALAASESEEMR